VDKGKAAYHGEGSGHVGKPRRDGEKVWVNDTKYFDGVPETAWNYSIGGYQPAQKWLKDRIGRKLEHTDIKHYQRIISALSATGKIVSSIDSGDDEPAAKSQPVSTAKK
jgi:hypothetical protein